MAFDPKLTGIPLEIVSATVKHAPWPEIRERISERSGASGFMILECDVEDFGGEIPHGPVTIAHKWGCLDQGRHAQARPSVADEPGAAGPDEAATGSGSAEPHPPAREG